MSRSSFNAHAACALSMWLLLASLALVPIAASALESSTLASGPARFRVVSIDLRRDRLELVWRDADDRAYASIDALRGSAEADGRRLLFATNAGMYDRSFRPLGLTIAGGSELRPLNLVRGDPAAGNFSIAPNGVFYVDRKGRAGVLKSSAWRASGIDARLATQSGPMLVVDGAINANFIADSDSRKWRSGVCAPDRSHAVFAVSLEPVTFHAFATLFRDTLHCEDALYLDGSLSRIYTSRDGYAGAPAMMVRPYAAMLAVFADD